LSTQKDKFDVEHFAFLNCRTTTYEAVNSIKYFT